MTFTYRFLLILALLAAPGALRAQQHTLQVITPFDYPRRAPNNTTVTGISSTGATVGFPPTATADAAFVRSANGIFRSLIALQDEALISGGINAAGVVCGYSVALTHAQTHHGYFFQN